MEFRLPTIGKPAIPMPHFPTKHQAFIFRAHEYIPAAKIARILGTTEENVRCAAEEMGLPLQDPDNLWLEKGYITIIRRMWHILPYEQLLDLLETDEETFAVTLREDDFLDVKLGQKPACDPVVWRELTKEERERTREIAEIMQDVPLDGVPPFRFRYDLPVLELSGASHFETRMIYAFSGLYQNPFDVDSRSFCPDEMLEAYSKLGVNAVWTQGILFRLTQFPFAPELSDGWEKRLSNLADFSQRLAGYGMKLFLYINEPRSMPAAFFEKYPDLKGHTFSEDKICLCTSTPEVREYLESGIETICRAAPDMGGFFTITRSENPTNCYSHAEISGRKCTCPRCSGMTEAVVIADTIGCYRRGADRVNPDIKVIAWSWGWDHLAEGIIEKLPERVILQCQSELSVPFEIGGVKGTVRDYSMSIPGPGETARREWAAAKKRGLETSAKVQINTTWEGSTVPALPVYPLIEKHMKALREEGVRHLMLSWTLGGYPSRNIAHAAKYFTEFCAMEEESENIRRAVDVFADAFREYPFHIGTLYSGPQNAGPSNLLYEKPTGYRATMTCFAYDDLESWRAIYPVDVFENQYAKLCARWKEGLEFLKDEPDCETVIMAKAAYCLYSSSLSQIRFIRAREGGDRETMLTCVREEIETARTMLELMNKDASIGFEAANHYYFSKGQIAEKIINCEYMLKVL